MSKREDDPRLPRALVSDRLNATFLSASLGVRVAPPADYCFNAAVTVELALTHLGALDATFDGETLRFTVHGNCERNDLSQALEWLAARIRVHSRDDPPINLRDKG